MKRIGYFLAVIGFLLMASGCDESESTSLESSMQQILDSHWEEYVQNKPGLKGGLAVQIFSPGCDCFLSTGMEDARDYSRFRCASTTKTFTAAAIMLLYQRGLLDIDDYLTDTIPGTSTPYIPNIPAYNIPNKGQITIKMLLMHRSGVFDLANEDIPPGTGSSWDGKNYISSIKDNDPYHQFTFDELLNVVATYNLSSFAPDARYGYSNTGYSLLGKIIEQVAGQSYNDFITNELIIPNNLVDTLAVGDARYTTMPRPFIPGYFYTGNASVDRTRDNVTANVAEGNLITSLFDLALWCKRLMTGQAGLSRAHVNMMMQQARPQKPGSTSLYGLGLEYVPSLGWGHNGAQQGYLTDMYYDPEKEVSCVMFANVWDISEEMKSLVTELQVMRRINTEMRALLH